MYGSWVRIPAGSPKPQKYLGLFLFHKAVTQLVEHPDFQSGGSWVLSKAFGTAGSLKASEKSGALIFFGDMLFLNMPFMYILYSEKLNKYYVGACTDL